MSSLPLTFRYFLVSLLPFLAFQLCAPYLIEYKFEQLLHDKAIETLERIDANSRKLDNAVAELRQRMNFQCDAYDQELLQKAFQGSHIIRVIGLITNDGLTCSSLGDGFVPKFEKLETINHDDGDKVQVGRYLTETTINFTGPRGTLFMLLSSKGSPFVVDRPCEDCFYLEIDLNGFGNLSIAGPLAIKTDLLAKEVRIASSTTKSHVHAWGGNQLHAHTSSWAYQRTMGAGLILSLLTYISLLLWQQHTSSLENLLRQAISLNELKPVYQAIVDARDGKVLGYEALLRWMHKGETIAPGVFIDIAESTGLIMPITEQLVGNVLKDMDNLPSDQWITLNIVAAHLESDSLTSQLAALGWPKGEQLMFELTERQQIKDIPAARRNIDLLLSHGYSIKIDDFGTGFGGMASLQQLNINCIKIDKMFVDTIGTDDLKAGVLDSMIKFGHDYKLQMIAEGVETREQSDFLLARGVFQQQGYLYAMPDSLPPTSNPHSEDLLTPELSA
ncbi:EAL domain-containing protein [Shewanella submarina]|uniref:cyclic-guanylate-specific phosphodiesterase n=1 Tax=Shewanella submarina TaxID=2016376 RepID=A0ABV7GFD7_9GAMM|nr:EAL domain-containing protein [Shewanella submarina]